MNFLSIAYNVLYLVAVGFSFLAGALIISKYLVYKRKDLLYLGIIAIIMSEPFWPAAVQSLLYGATGELLPLEIYIILGNLLVPIAILLWLIVFTKLVEVNIISKNKQIILIAWSICTIIFEIVFLTLIFTGNTSLIAWTDVEKSVVRYTTPMIVFLISCILILFITVNIFINEALRSDDPTIRLKGKLIFFGFLFYYAGCLSIIDEPLNLPLILGWLYPIFIIISAILLYSGFILPQWVRRIFKISIEEK